MKPYQYYAGGEWREYIDSDDPYQPAFDHIRGAELCPGRDANDDDEVLAAVRRYASCAHHPIGTCKMGLASDPGAVVDADLKVRGIEGLRVVDASIMPAQITATSTGRS